MMIVPPILPPPFKVLVVDDILGQPGHDRNHFLDLLKREDHEFVFTTGQTEQGHNDPDVTLDAVERLWNGKGTDRLALVLLDVRFKDQSDPRQNRFGFTLLRALRGKFDAELPIIMLTAEDGVASQANEAKADGFLPKEKLTSETFNERLFRHGLYPDSGKLFGRSRAFLKVLREVRRVAANGQREVLLLGETGCGKSNLARFIHDTAQRKADRWAPCFSRKTNQELHYSDLFGHWMGAYNEAKEHKAGFAEQAHLGTLFIDEIGELHPNAQADLLEYRTVNPVDKMRRVRRLGLPPVNPRAKACNLIGEYSEDEKRILVDTFLISASNKPIDDPKWREENSFREDLANRLGYRITLPPLRERIEDIADLFVMLLKRETGRDVELTPGVQAALEAHEWKEGNVEELRQVAVAINNNLSPEFDELYPHHLAGLLRKGEEPKLPVPNASLRMSGNNPPEKGVQSPPMARPAPPVALVSTELRHMWYEAQSLLQAIVETARPKQRVAPFPDVLAQWRGVSGKTTDAKREFGRVLRTWFDTNSRTANKWAKIPGYSEAAQQIRSDDILSALYKYAVKQIDGEEAKKLIGPALPDITARGRVP